MGDRCPFIGNKLGGGGKQKWNKKISDKKNMTLLIVSFFFASSYLLFISKLISYKQGKIKKILSDRML